MRRRSKRRVQVATPPADVASYTLYTKDLCVGYGFVPVLRDVTINARQGEVIAVLGANGAGKSTLLKALAGVLSPTSGGIWCAGKPAAKGLATRARSGISFVPEGRSVFGSLTVKDNLKLGRGGVADALAVVPELERLQSRRAAMLSGGEQQYLSLARAIAAKPSILLADELSLGLAPLIVTSLLQAVRRAADDGAAVVLVEQHIRQALAVADRVYVLARGRVVLQGTTEELSSRVEEIEATYLSGAHEPDAAESSATSDQAVS
jgi:branched-chain amino acid transport system ATP-binding protein